MSYNRGLLLFLSYSPAQFHNFLAISQNKAMLIWKKREEKNEVYLLLSSCIM